MIPDTLMDNLFATTQAAGIAIKSPRVGIDPFPGLTTDRLRSVAMLIFLICIR